jgi:hypothetical protein
MCELRHASLLVQKMQCAPENTAPAVRREAEEN